MFLSTRTTLLCEKRKTHHELTDGTTKKHLESITEALTSAESFTMIFIYNNNNNNNNNKFFINDYMKTCI